jgi:hypothetical protein
MEMTGAGSGLDFATFVNSALNRGGGSGGWGDGEGGFLWILLVLLLGGGAWGNGWGGRGGATGGAAESVDRAVAQARADGLSDQVVIDAVRGNATAISQLASTLNCDIEAIQTVLCGMDKSIMQVSNQVGLASTQIINAVQAGNCQITQAIAQCCCDMKGMQYENRIQNMEQTNALTGVMNAGFNQLGNKIDAQTLAMTQGFQNLRDYLTAEKIETLQHKVTRLQNEADNAAQTLAFRAAIDAATTPIQNRVETLVGRIPPSPVPAYPAPQFATGYTFGVIPTNNCYQQVRCGCGCDFGGA